MGSVTSCYYNTDGATFSSPPYLKEAPRSKNGGGTSVRHHQPSHVPIFKLQMQQKIRAFFALYVGSCLGGPGHRVARVPERDAWRSGDSYQDWLMVGAGRAGPAQPC